MNHVKTFFRLKVRGGYFQEKKYISKSNVCSPKCGKIKSMDRIISHDRTDETPEAKAIWFRSLSLSERMEMLCAFTDLVLAINPGIADLKDAKQTRKGIRVLSKSRS